MGLGVALLLLLTLLSYYWNHPAPYIRPVSLANSVTNTECHGVDPVPSTMSNVMPLIQCHPRPSSPLQCTLLPATLCLATWLLGQEEAPGQEVSAPQTTNSFENTPNTLPPEAPFYFPKCWLAHLLSPHRNAACFKWMKISMKVLSHCLVQNSTRAPHCGVRIRKCQNTTGFTPRLFWQAEKTRRTVG